VAAVERQPTTVTSAGSGASTSACAVEVVVGRISRAHGLGGDVLVDVRTDEPARRFTGGARLETARGEVIVRTAHWHGVRLIVRFQEVSDRESAEALRGLELRVQVDPDERPDDPAEFYDHQIVGLDVMAADGRWVGQVSEVLHLAAQDVLIVRSQAGSECLIPFVVALVPTVDIAGGRLRLAEEAEELVIAAPAPSRAARTDEILR
jgi:16S rRNA processing protein RimM